MNHPLIIQLIEVINAEIRIFHQLLAVLHQEQKALVEDDLEGIETAAAAKEKALQEAKELEAARLQVVEDLSHHLEMAPGNITLTRLIETLEKQQGEELARMRGILLELNHKIRNTNENNAFLIRQSVRYTSRCLDILSGQPENQGTYGKSGRAWRKGSRHWVVNQTA